MNIKTPVSIDTLRITNAQHNIHINVMRYIFLLYRIYKSKCIQVLCFVYCSAPNMITSYCTLNVFSTFAMKIHSIFRIMFQYLNLTKFL